MNTLKKDPIGLALLAAIIITLFTGCASFGLSWTNGQETVTATLDRKSIRLHGGVNLDGGEVGGDVWLPLPRKHKGLSK